jgi:hypothetical protein
VRRPINFTSPAGQHSSKKGAGWAAETQADKVGLDRPKVLRPHPFCAAPAAATRAQEERSAPLPLQQAQSAEVSALSVLSEANAFLYSSLCPPGEEARTRAAVVALSTPGTWPPLRSPTPPLPNSLLNGELNGMAK